MPFERFAVEHGRVCGPPGPGGDEAVPRCAQELGLCSSLAKWEAGDVSLDSWYSTLNGTFRE